MSSANQLTGSIYQWMYDIKSYQNLKQQNHNLALENAQLRAQIPDNMKLLSGGLVLQSDSIYKQRFNYKVAEVIQNSIYNKNNYLTINVGKNDGIEPQMGVITPQGTVGFVSHVSDNYATVLSFLNSNASVSVMFLNNNATGTMLWSGNHHQDAIIKDIPLTTQVEISDTLITSGYSTYYPKGIIVGIVKEKSIGDNKQMHELKVKLIEDFNQLNTVYVVENLDKLELKKLTDQLNSTFND